MRQVPSSITSRPGLIHFLPYFIAIIIDAISFVIISPILPNLIANLHLSSEFHQHALYGYILSLYSLSYMIGAPILGAISDYWGRRKVLIVCASGALIGFSLYALSFITSSLTLLLIARIVSGFSSGSQCIAQAAMIDLSHERNKANNIGLIAVAMTTGLVIGPLLGGLFNQSNDAGWHHYQWAFYAIMALASANLMMLIKQLKETYQQHSLNTELKRLNHHLKDFFKLLFNPKLRLWLLTFLLFELSWSLYYQSLAIMLYKSLKIESQPLALFLSFVGISLSFALFFLVRLVSKRPNHLSILKYSLMAGTLALIANALLNSFSAYILLAVIITASVGLGYTGLITELSKRCPSDSQGLLMGITDGLLALAFTITGILAGLLSYYFTTLPLFIAALFLALAIALFNYCHRSHHETLP